MLVRIICYTGILALCGGAAKAQSAVTVGDEPNDTVSDDHAAYSRNALYAELGGVAGLYSINYERRLGDRWSVRVGGTWHRIRFLGEPAEMTGPAFGVNRHLLSVGALHVEVGAAVHPLRVKGTYDCFLICSEEEWTREGEPYKRMLVLASPSVGVRVQRARGGPMIRLTKAPLFGVNLEDGEFFAGPWGGLSLGWGF